MHRLSVLGPPQISGLNAQAAEPLLRQPKRLALLAYLVLCRPHGPKPRDSIFPLLWPDSDSVRARSSLRQAIRSLRDSLGPEVVVSHGSVAVEIDEAYLWCDAREFDRLVDQGELEPALGLYRGDLLDGFYVSGIAPEYEHWLDSERARLRRRAIGAVEQLIRRFSDQRNWDRAVDWARRRVELVPFDEQATRALVTLLLEAGQVQSAAAEYEQFAHHLERVHEIAPSEEMRALAGRIEEALAARAPEMPLANDAPVVSSPPAAAPAPDRSAEGGAIATEIAAAPLNDVVVSPPPGRAKWRPIARRAMAVVAAALILAAVVSFGAQGSASAPLEAARVAVLPFRAGGADPELAFLREGMVDLISVRLDSDESLKAVDARTVLGLWRRTAAEGTAPLAEKELLRIAAKTGAAEAVIGELVGTRDRLYLNASLLSVKTGRLIARATTQGPADSLGVLTDELTGRLLMARSGTPDSKLQRLARVPLPAVRAYLAGETYYREGDYQKAATSYQQALEIDSTFAPAILGALSALRWAGDSEGMHRVGAGALRIRERFTPSDRALLDAHLSAHTPSPATQAQQLAAWEQAIRAQPTSAEAWYFWGDTYYHWGPALGLANAGLQARRAFERAIALDPAAEAPITHLAELLAHQGDLEAAREVYGRIKGDKDSENRVVMEWLFANLAPDGKTTGARIAHMDPVSLSRLIGYAQLFGVAPADADQAVRELHRRGAAPSEVPMVLTHLYHAALNRGRRDELRRVVDWAQSWAPSRSYHLEMPVMAALYSDGDSLYAARAAQALVAEEDRIIATARRPSVDEYDILCTAEQWQIRHGNTTRSEKAIALLRAPPGGGEIPLVTEKRHGCAIFLTALLNIELGRPSIAIPLLRQLSADLRAGVYGWWEPPHLSNLVLAEQLESLGRPQEALEILRRRPHHSQHGIQYLSSFLIREGRLAATVGDTAGALRAYRHYLVLRRDPDPSLASLVGSVRSRVRELATTRVRVSPTNAERR